MKKNDCINLEEGITSFPIIILFSSQINCESGDVLCQWRVAHFYFEGNKLISSKFYKSLR